MVETTTVISPRPGDAARTGERRIWPCQRRAGVIPVAVAVLLSLMLHSCAREVPPAPAPRPTPTADEAANEALTDITAGMVRKRLEYIPRDHPRRTEVEVRLAFIEAKEQREAHLPVTPSRYKQLRAEHPQWSDGVCVAIAGGEVRVGMTQEQCALAWGRPQRVRETTTASGTVETWCYGDFCQRSLLFRDGVLASASRESGDR